jgi:histidinol-phosphate aminotransferase
MPLSRRHLLRRLGAGAAASAAISPIKGFCLSGVLPPSAASQPAGLIRLDRNENAYGPSEKAISAMREGTSLANRYPDSEWDGLANRIAQVHGVAPEQVVLGCGSSEVLRLATATFLGPGKKLVMALPSWNLMADFARTSGAEVVAVPLNKQYAHDLTAMLDRIDSSTGLVYVCNPNNPTGSLTRRDDLTAFIHRVPSTVHVLIDEAYYDYVAGTTRDTSLTDQTVNDERVIVTRTFSAIYALAGLRVGYGIAAPRTAGLLARGRLPFGVNIVAARAAAAALGDTEHVRASVQQNANDRQEFLNRVNGRMLRAIDSHANFVMLNTGQRAEVVVEHFRKNNIILPHPFPPLDKYVRVSLGAREDMDEFWRVWDLMPSSHEMRM